MCGIVGLWRLNGPVRRQELESLAAAMVHRGPDSSGLALLHTAAAACGKDETDLGLAHRRLAIIDLTEGGHQPMVFRDLTLIFNGEIYNYHELRATLRGCGHAFATASDTEVLLHAWAEWGADCLERLNGIFAFLLWDDLSQRLHAVRDRVGVKPMYYFADHDQIGFASEIKPLLAARQVSVRLDEGLVYDFVAGGRMDHTEETMFQGIKRLPGGCRMEISRGVATAHRYWRLDSRLVEDRISLPDAAEKFRSLFCDSIRLQMRADVPVACCLSGGLDSSSVAAVATASSAYRMSAFSARFEDSSMDEWAWAELMHRASPLDPVSVTVRPELFWKELPDLIKAQEEPFASPGIYAQWCVMKAIKERGIRVTLDGQGGDEILCGYAKYFYWSLRDLLKKGQIIAAAASSMDGLLHGGDYLFNWGGARRYLPGLLRTRRAVSHLLQPWFDERQGNRILERAEGNTREQQVLDIETYSLPVLLRYEDKNSMAHSVEARVPFLDHRLVEFCVGLPTAMKISGSKSKFVLREGLQQDVPKSILQRRSKLGFGGDFRSWVSDLWPQLLSWVGDETRPVFQIVRPDGVRHLIEGRDPRVFRMLSLDAWLTAFHLES
jgi:asparagine synthase (glutamine-hydrolysing)